MDTNSKQLQVCFCCNRPLSYVEAKRRAIVLALRATGGKKEEAAELLQISRTTLYRKLIELNIQRFEYIRKFGEELVA